MTFVMFAGLLFLQTAAHAGDFPIGVFGVPRADVFEELLQAGFTHVLPADIGLESQRALADAAAHAGLQFIGYPQPEMTKRREGFPVAGWYLSDEPDVNGISSASLRLEAQSVRDWDAKSRLYITVGDGRRAVEYASAVDAVMVDWYPVPHLPLTSLGDHIAFAKSLVKDRPIWAVVQAMDWRDYPQRDPKRIGRFPTIAELKFMAYDAVINGADGLFFFEFRIRSSPGSTLLDSTENWAALRTIAQELSILRPILARGERIQWEFGAMRGVTFRRNGTMLTILANRSPKPQSLPERFQSPKCRTLFEDRIVPNEALPGNLLGPVSAIVLAGC